MTRRLSEEEEALWEHLRRSVKPLAQTRQHAQAKSPLAEPKPEPKREQTKRATPVAPAAQAPKPKKGPPALASLEDKTRRGLSRGKLPVDAKIDLHGMRQERAFRALSAFLRARQHDGARIVLVVTGKGREGEEGLGVLRQSVPEWLSRGDLRDVVVGFEPAGRRHGGDGALYVRIRRRREARARS